jgi:hypothetical protein
VIHRVLPALLAGLLLLPASTSAEEVTKVRKQLGEGWTYLEAGNLRKAEEAFTGAFEDPVGRSTAEVYYAIAAVWWEKRNAMAAYMWLSDAGKARKESFTWDGGPGGEWDHRIDARKRYVEGNFTVIKLRSPRRGKPLPPLADPTPSDPLLREFTDRLPTVVQEGVEADVAVQWVLLPNGTYWIGEQLVPLQGGELDASKAASWELPADRGKAKSAYAERVAALSEGRSMAKEAGAALQQAEADAAAAEEARAQEEASRRADLEAERQATLARQAKELEAERAREEARRQAELRRADEDRAERARREEAERAAAAKEDEDRARAEADRAAKEQRLAEERRADEERRRREAERALAAEEARAAREAGDRDAAARDLEERRRAQEAADEEARLAEARRRQQAREAEDAAAKAAADDRWAAAARQTEEAEARREEAARAAQARREAQHASGDAAEELRGRRFYLAGGGGLAVVERLEGEGTSAEADWAAQVELGGLVPIGHGPYPVALGIGVSYDAIPLSGCPDRQTRGHALALHVAPRLSLPIRERAWVQGRVGLHVGAAATWPSTEERQACAEGRAADGSGPAYGVRLGSDGAAPPLSYGDLGWGGYALVFGPDFEVGVLGAPGASSTFVGASFFLRHDQVFAAVDGGDYHVRSPAGSAVDLEAVQVADLDPSASMPRFQLGVRATVQF